MLYFYADFFHEIILSYQSKPFFRFNNNMCAFVKFQLSLLKMKNSEVSILLNFISTQ